METIQPDIIAPWEPRISSITDMEEAKSTIKQSSGVLITTSSSAKNGIVGMGSIIYMANQNTPISLSVTLGPRTEQNLYTAELTAIAQSMDKIAQLPLKEITIVTSNLAVVQVINQPRRQSGQVNIDQIYQINRSFKKRNIVTRVVWIIKNNKLVLGEKVKMTVHYTTRIGQTP